jgi:hypothetical protein
MTLLENIYHHLHNNGLVNNREHFSKQYLGKSKNWYAVQTHYKRDFSTSATIECLHSIRTAQVSNEPIYKEQKTTLDTIEDLLKQHLNNILKYL